MRHPGAARDAVLLVIAVALAALARRRQRCRGDATIASRATCRCARRAHAQPRCAPPRVQPRRPPLARDRPVRFRTRSPAGALERLATGAPEAEDRPGRGSRERRATPAGGSATRGGSGRRPDPVPRVTGRVTRLRALLRLEPGAARPAAHAADGRRAADRPARGWHADEKIRARRAALRAALRFAVVHHTAGTNSLLARRRRPAIVRGIQLYHVKGNGWNDIGYNFLVDRYGTVYEGRYGGVDRNVVGAHAQGFNTGSVGVARDRRTTSTRRRRRRRAATRSRGCSPGGSTSRTSTRSRRSRSSRAASERFAAGVPVFLRAVSGHRDTGFTDLPGRRASTRGSARSRRAARTIGLPKLYAPTRDGESGRSVRFTGAALVSRCRGRCASRTPRGAEVARGNGTGTAVDWTWDVGAGAPAGRTRGRSRPALRTARGGHVRAGGGAAAAARSSAAAATPATITPERRRPGRHGDGRRYTLTAAANVTRRASTERSARSSRPRSTARWTARRARTRSPSTADALADGALQRACVTAAAPRPASRSRSMLRCRRQSHARPRAGRAPLGALSPNGDGRSDSPRSLTFALAAPATVRRAHRARRQLGRDAVRRRVSSRRRSASPGTAQAPRERCATARTPPSSRRRAARHHLVSSSRSSSTRRRRAVRSYPAAAGPARRREPATLTLRRRRRSADDAGRGAGNGAHSPDRAARDARRRRPGTPPGTRATLRR